MSVPPAKRIPDGSRPKDLRLLPDPKWGTLFDSGFHSDRGGTDPLPMLAVFLEARIALTFVQPVASGDKANSFEK